MESVEIVSGEMPAVESAGIVSGEMPAVESAGIVSGEMPAVESAEIVIGERPAVESAEIVSGEMPAVEAAITEQIMVVSSGSRQSESTGCSPHDNPTKSSPAQRKEVVNKPAVSVHTETLPEGASGQVIQNGDVEEIRRLSALLGTERTQRQRADDWTELLTRELDAQIEARACAEEKYFTCERKYNALRRKHRKISSEYRNLLSELRRRPGSQLTVPARPEAGARASNTGKKM